MKTLFLTLRTFSATGGIEKVCRVAAKAMHELATGGEAFRLYSMHDAPGSRSQPYIPESACKGFGSARLPFMLQAIREGARSRVVVLSHINLLIAGYLIKSWSPNTKVIMLAHGIEVWRPVPAAKKKMLQAMDQMVCVSHFTKEKMREIHNIPEKRLTVINNCLDPFLPEPPGIAGRKAFREKYGYAEKDMVLMTLSRLSAKEKSKHYDKVLIAIKELLPVHPCLKYLFVGKYEEAEKNRLTALAAGLGIAAQITFTGFVPDAALGDYYNLADVYIMPSEKEGFGISFIEAMYYNKPVIAGNRDGTADALANGKLGLMVDPRSQDAVTAALQKVVANPGAFTPERELLLGKFSYRAYKEKWKNVLEALAG